MAPLIVRPPLGFGVETVFVGEFTQTMPLSRPTQPDDDDVALYTVKTFVGACGDETEYWFVLKKSSVIPLFAKNPPFAPNVQPAT